MCLSSVLLPQIPAMSSLSALFSVLCEHPYVSAILDINGCISFLELVRLIKPDLELHLRPGDIGPMDFLWTVWVSRAKIWNSSGWIENSYLHYMRKVIYLRAGTKRSQSAQSVRRLPKRAPTQRAGAGWSCDLAARMAKAVKCHCEVWYAAWKDGTKADFNSDGIWQSKIARSFQGAWQDAQDVWGDICKLWKNISPDEMHKAICVCRMGSTQLVLCVLSMCLIPYSTCWWGPWCRYLVRLITHYISF
jgi:hypothetical protein